MSKEAHQMSRDDYQDNRIMHLEYVTDNINQALIRLESSIKEGFSSIRDDLLNLKKEINDDFGNVRDDFSSVRKEINDLRSESATQFRWIVGIIIAFFSTVSVTSIAALFKVFGH